MTEPVAEGVRTAADVLARTRDLVEPALRRTVGTLPPSMRRVAGYHFGWWDARGRPTPAGGGKALRPAFTLLAAESAGGDPDTALPAAVAVELVHNFSLVHDDVMDGDAVRRHRPTVWNVFGRSEAILAGDSLLALAFAVLAEGGRPADSARTLARCVQSLLDGQSADLGFEERADVSLGECVRMAEGKTGALFGCACALGALQAAGLSGAPPPSRRPSCECSASAWGWRSRSWTTCWASGATRPSPANPCTPTCVTGRSPCRSSPR
ncbi:hypothetical protein GCM10027612_50830 [Microbispora bryophytorum subsp. camponoti]